MKIAFIIFNNITWLDMAGVYDPITRLKGLGYLPDLQWEICSFTNTVMDNYGLEIKPGKVAEDLSSYDVIIVPGGHGTRNLQYDENFLNWLRTASTKSTKISICTGSLLLGSAGFLVGKKATTNFKEYEALKEHGALVIKERIVEDGNIITAGAVTSSIDLGLFLCLKWSGQEAAEVIRERMDYKG